MDSVTICLGGGWLLTLVHGASFEWGVIRRFGHGGLPVFAVRELDWYGRHYDMTMRVN